MNKGRNTKFLFENRDEMSCGGETAEGQTFGGVGTKNESRGKKN